MAICCYLFQLSDFIGQLKPSLVSRFFGQTSTILAKFLVFRNLFEQRQINNGMDDIFKFAKIEHERQVLHYHVKGNPKTKYTILAKLMEEVGELSEAILSFDSLQRKDKLKGAKHDLEGELADVVIVTLILANELNVDMNSALTKKIKKIKLRKY
jgi:NTP pyrophosphatase (non-canonical NTP hydrolase)